VPQPSFNSSAQRPEWKKENRGADAVGRLRRNIVEKRDMGGHPSLWGWGRDYISKEILKIANSGGKRPGSRTLKGSARWRGRISLGRRLVEAGSVRSRKGEKSLFGIAGQFSRKKGETGVRHEHPLIERERQR